MNVLEIAVGEFVSALRILRVPFVDAEMPFCIFTESVQTDKLVFFIRRRPMGAPRALAVRNYMSLVDELRCEREGTLV